MSGVISPTQGMSLARVKVLARTLNIKLTNNQGKPRTLASLKRSVDKKLQRIALPGSIPKGAPRISRLPFGDRLAEEEILDIGGAEFIPPPLPPRLETIFDPNLPPPPRSPPRRRRNRVDRSNLGKISTKTEGILRDARDLLASPDGAKLKDVKDKLVDVGKDIKEQFDKKPEDFARDVAGIGLNKLGALIAKAKVGAPPKEKGGQCPKGKVRDAGLCYRPCSSNTKGAGPLCLQKSFGRGVGTVPNFCLPGTRNIAGRCWTRRFPRHIRGRAGCPPNKERDAGLCYKKCGPGFNGRGPVCWGKQKTVGRGVGTVPPRTAWAIRKGFKEFGAAFFTTLGNLVPAIADTLKGDWVAVVKDFSTGVPQSLKETKQRLSSIGVPYKKNGRQLMSVGMSDLRAPIKRQVKSITRKIR